MNQLNDLTVWNLFELMKVCHGNKKAHLKHIINRENL